MNQLKRWLVWISRIHCCRGFGIQSPTDYAFVRYVVNEHWPYYAYERLTADDWLTRKLGQLYLRLANWRQPHTMRTDEYRQWWQAGCRRIAFVADSTDRVELARITVENREAWGKLLPQCDEHSVVVIEGIHRDRQHWHDMEHDERVGTTFDLYYCGIVFFDTARYKNHYTINF